MMDHGSSPCAVWVTTETCRHCLPVPPPHICSKNLLIAQHPLPGTPPQALPLPFSSLNSAAHQSSQLLSALRSSLFLGSLKHRPDLGVSGVPGHRLSWNNTHQTQDSPVGSALTGTSPQQFCTPHTTLWILPTHPGVQDLPASPYSDLASSIRSDLHSTITHIRGDHLIKRKGFFFN